MSYKSSEGLVQLEDAIGNRVDVIFDRPSDGTVVIEREKKWLSRVMPNR